MRIGLENLQHPEERSNIWRIFFSFPILSFLSIWNEVSVTLYRLACCIFLPLVTSMKVNFDDTLVKKKNGCLLHITTANKAGVPQWVSLEA